MKNRYVLKTFLIFALSFSVVFGGFYASTYIQKKKMHGESLTNFVVAPAKALIAKRSPLLPNYRHMIRIEMQIQQKPKSEQGHIEEVVFDGKKVPLQSIDSTGKRGQVFARVKPGTHTITWKVQNHQYIWPRTTTFTRTLVVSKEQLWVHVMIRGEDIEIN